MNAEDTTPRMSVEHIEDVPSKSPIRGNSESGSLNAARLFDQASFTSLDGANFLRLPAVCARVAMQRTTIYKLIDAGSFPRSIKVGGASLWLDCEISRWMEEQVAARDAPASAVTDSMGRRRRRG